VSPAVSPDGTRIAFLTMRHRNDINNGNTSEIYVMDINGSNQIRLSNNSGIDDDAPRWCDNNRLLYSSEGSVIEIDAADINNDGNGDNPNIIVVAVNNDYNYSVDCSTSSIVFVRDPGRYVVLTDRNGVSENYLGGGGLFTSEQPRFSPNGSRIAYGSTHIDPSSTIRDVFVMDAADVDNNQQGDNRQRITTSSLGSGSSNPAWSPASSHIVFSRDVGGNYELRKIELSTSAETLIVAAPPNGFVGDWD
jgi:dipeptidyl aminopeptidase/acylaminoacyl peptidase